MSERFRKEIKSWLETTGIKRKTLAQEAGYHPRYLNDLLSCREVSIKAERNFRAAMKRLEEDPPEDSDMITIQLSAEALEKIKKAAEMLKMNIDQFIEAFLPPEE